MYTINVPLHAHGQDNTVAVWDMISPMDIFLRKVLKGHANYVLVVDFDDKYIVSGSWDNTIKVYVGGRGIERRVEREEGEENTQEDGEKHAPITAFSY